MRRFLSKNFFSPFYSSINRLVIVRLFIHKLIHLITRQHFNHNNGISSIKCRFTFLLIADFINKNLSTTAQTILQRFIHLFLLISIVTVILVADLRLFTFVDNDPDTFSPSIVDREQTKNSKLDFFILPSVREKPSILYRF